MLSKKLERSETVTSVEGSCNEKANLPKLFSFSPARPKLSAVASGPLQPFQHQVLLVAHRVASPGVVRRRTRMPDQLLQAKSSGLEETKPSSPPWRKLVHGCPTPPTRRGTRPKVSPLLKRTFNIAEFLEASLSEPVKIARKLAHLQNCAHQFSALNFLRQMIA